MEYCNCIDDIDLDCSGEQKLCIACIIQAVKDLHYDKHSFLAYSPKAKVRLKEQTIRWFRSDSTEPFSFLWCLEHAFPELYDKLDVDYIIQICLKKPLKCRRSIGHLPESRSLSMYIKQ